MQRRDPVPLSNLMKQWRVGVTLWREYDLCSRAATLYSTLNALQKLITMSDEGGNEVSLVGGRKAG